MLKILFLSSFILLSTASNACLTYSMEDYVLLEKLPPNAIEQAVVAKVRLLVNKDRYGTVQVIEAVKGVIEGQVFDVEVGLWSCSHLASRLRSMDEVKKELVSDAYFLAGNWKQLKDKNVFVGGWRDGKRVAYPKLE